MKSGSFQPGDITVTPIPGGYLLGRIVHSRGPGPWWTYIKTTENAKVALREARQMATSTHARAWFYQDSAYREIRED